MAVGLFPMDMSVLTGLVNEEELLEERPEYVERMRQLAQLEQLERVVPPRRGLWQITLAGAVPLALGLGLLAGIFLAIAGG